MIDKELIQLIEKNLATQFEKDLFWAAIENISYSNNPLRFNNFAYAVRELTRHVLKRLAPDKEVLKSKWYTNETKKEKGISRGQRIYYAIHGGLLPSYVQETLRIDVKTHKKNFLDILDRLSEYTHVEKETFGLDEGSVFQDVNETLSILVEFFNFITETSLALSEALQEHADIGLFNTVIEQTYSEIDRQATHHYLEDVHTETIEFLEIDHEYIYFEANGSIEYLMQWGSNSDLAKGDGIEFNKSIPFKCRLRSDILNPSSIEVDIDSLEIDTTDIND